MAAMRVTGFHAVFAAVVVLCLAQVAWWIVFHGQDAARLAEAGAALERSDVERALAILGAKPGHSLADEANRRFVMFASEGAAFTLALLAGVVTFFVMLRQRWQLVAAQERFLAGATHAWRTPLASLRLAIESFLAGRVPDAKRERYLSAMLGDVGRLDHDVGNLLAAAQLSRRAPASLHEPGDLRADVTKAIDAVRTRAENAGVQIETDLSEVRVSRDPAAFVLAVQNLLDNAVKYSKPSGRVRVNLVAKGGVAELSIRDDGVGMTSEDLERIFARFTRGSAKEHAGGTGLGLWIVREIVNAHRGSVTATSGGPGHGSTFVLTIPLLGAHA